MSRDIESIALALFAAGIAACSGTPRSSTLPTDQPAVGAAAHQPSAPQTLALANNAPIPATVVAPPTGEVDANLVKAGYSVMKRHGEVYYCRNEIITGQRIGTRICLTAAQLQVEKENVTKARDLMNQPSYECLGASCKN